MGIAWKYETIPPQNLWILPLTAVLSVDFSVHVLLASDTCVCNIVK